MYHLNTFPFFLLTCVTRYVYDNIYYLPSLLHQHGMQIIWSKYFLIFKIINQNLAEKNWAIQQKSAESLQKVWFFGVSQRHDQGLTYCTVQEKINWTFKKWHVTVDTWNVTCDMWRITCDTLRFIFPCKSDCHHYTC